MSLQDRDRRARTNAPATGGAGPDPSASAEARERAARLAEAGDRAIRDALSQDSARFLAQNRQQSGQ